ncbi:MAG: Na+/H+ antiporter subunit G [Gammaproteobacteria bacterium]|uniref:Na+/H+ antiporter subunit G n=1 Tax=Rhodoferax sp. TaxID=50421 RepID=UPI00180E8A93|nr:Na+/H+ antiporter subunit G [Rhodoferax sp.]MBU3897636.1 Na+/H+ antiporter subunit G [Gammaproteobacteria bacterium]MBA3058262.1 Na+/H+ antiporter subunit G [Rhodoferax sp.]MBU3999459.1 Na+/H+ antiporter subunit G [Gammaproteobacteria bacterium]MBU4017720.1 Na+/H+ antiporter subunit G [Gammaproteobacteria bacterium]MBU4081163.1 Na+/H+ antiporter subunit G [Gammaproteobacteria bacterium]
MNTTTEVLLSLLVLIGAGFTFVGSLSLVRFKDIYTRLHGPTKATTLGVGCLLVASSVFFSVTGAGLSLHEILVTFFLFITAPVSAHLLTKAALHLGLPSVAPLPEAAPATQPTSPSSTHN